MSDVRCGVGVRDVLVAGHPGGAFRVRVVAVSNDGAEARLVNLSTLAAETVRVADLHAAFDDGLLHNTGPCEVPRPARWWSAPPELSAALLSAVLPYPRPPQPTTWPAAPLPVSVAVPSVLRSWAMWVMRRDGACWDAVAAAFRVSRSSARAAARRCDAKVRRAGRLGVGPSAEPRSAERAVRRFRTDGGLRGWRKRRVPAGPVAVNLEQAHG